MRYMKSDIQLKLGKKIKALRQKRGLTQDKLGELTGIDVKYIQKIEGKTPPAIRIPTLERIAKALKVSPAKLLEL